MQVGVGSHQSTTGTGSSTFRRSQLPVESSRLGGEVGPLEGEADEDDDENEVVKGNVEESAR